MSNRDEILERDDPYRPWRTGRKVGRTIYEQVGPEPSDDDVLIGVMDTPALADGAVASRNFVAACPEGVTQLPIQTLTDMDAQLDRLKARADRLRAALEQIASPNRSTYEKVGDVAAIARTALDAPVRRNEAS